MPPVLYFFLLCNFVAVPAPLLIVATARWSRKSVIQPAQAQARTTVAS